MCAVAPNWAFRALELDFYERNADRPMGTETDTEYVLIIQHYVAERFFQTVRDVLGGALDGFIDSFRELSFILVTFFLILVDDIVSIDERKIPVCDHRAETWHSIRESHGVWLSLPKFGIASDKFHAKLPDFRRSGISVEVAVVQ